MFFTGQGPNVQRILEKCPIPARMGKLSDNTRYFFHRQQIKRPIVQKRKKKRGGNLPSTTTMKNGKCIERYPNAVSSFNLFICEFCVDVRSVVDERRGARCCSSKTECSWAETPSLKLWRTGNRVTEFVFACLLFSSTECQSLTEDEFNSTTHEDEVVHQWLVTFLRFLEKCLLTCVYVYAVIVHTKIRKLCREHRKVGCKKREKKLRRTPCPLTLGSAPGIGLSCFENAPLWVYREASLHAVCMTRNVPCVHFLCETVILAGPSWPSKCVWTSSQCMFHGIIRSDTGLVGVGGSHVSRGFSDQWERTFSTKSPEHIFMVMSVVCWITGPFLCGATRAGLENHETFLKHCSQLPHQCLEIMARHWWEVEV